MSRPIARLHSGARAPFCPRDAHARARARGAGVWACLNDAHGDQIQTAGFTDRALTNGIAWLPPHALRHDRGAEPGIRQTRVAVAARGARSVACPRAAGADELPTLRVTGARIGARRRARLPQRADRGPVSAATTGARRPTSARRAAAGCRATRACRAACARRAPRVRRAARARRAAGAHAAVHAGIRGPSRPERATGARRATPPRTSGAASTATCSRVVLHVGSDAAARRRADLVSATSARIPRSRICIDPGDMTPPEGTPYRCNPPGSERRRPLLGPCSGIADPQGSPRPSDRCGCTPRRDRFHRSRSRSCCCSRCSSHRLFPSRHRRQHREAPRARRFESREPCRTPDR